MSDTLAGLASIAALVALLALAYRPLGDYMAAVYSSDRHLRAERLVYRLTGVDPRAEQSARSYAVSVVAFSLVGVALLMAMQLAQAHLPFSRGLPGVPFWMSFNTAASFVANTNWQSYAGESTLGFTVQMAGLAVQNFASAAVGMAVAIALIRGFTRTRTGNLGNFWVDLTRGTLRILLPIAAVAAVLLMAGGVVQTFSDIPMDTLAGHGQTLTGGPVASQEAIKELGTNGGGFFNANSAHPFENPSGYTNLLEILLILLIPVCLTRTLGTLLGNRRQGLAVLAAMGVLFAVSLAAVTAAEVGARSQAAQAAGAAMEGKETRFGEWASALFAVATTGTSTGAVNASHDSLTPTGGGVVLLNMMFGEVTPGGVGSGIYGILVLAIVAVFIAGLMVGRTPELLGKKIGARQMTYVATYLLITPSLVLVGTGVAIALGSTSDAMGNPGGHGFSEVLYAYTSGANNNGSAFGGITVTSDFFQITIGLAMLLGRLVPIVLVLLLAGSLAEQGRVPTTAGTLPTHQPVFVTLLVGVVVLFTALTYFPALSLGPLAEALA
ncbi:potassium-transporting ATPase subunit KdpA [Nocardioides sp. zg-579]|uniref:Potassium-transporting ATPase potassium-binding subunit n=1 Tax=Nocardioides marmotae TaxID=2663857 RepID=A0A6I3JA07_9ACTN|nr:potassium-transporting ATPase subunit KdpA [Nocardioides marmotae]MCR6031491.1 potassium-transporting ATPase subunit KdpA [Gordonia jinghuaiqii]MTB95130.1 potassium-transporting ATPase subunit KdpA [Nocardioides marmotae]QKE02382.1 potassium-transporting ATPase subunit KdpA [Nocardioides marmotae]